MKKVYIVGIGIGNTDFLHKRAFDVLSKCGVLIGAQRMLDGFSNLAKETYTSSDSKSIYEYIKKSSHNIFGVLVSGDTGFYSLSKKLTELLQNKVEFGNQEIEIENIPAISSLQYFTSKLNLSWDNIKYVSAHGRKLNIISNVVFNEKLFMLTDNEMNPSSICEILKSKGLGNLKVSIGENLSYDNERIVEDKAVNIVGMKFSGLSVMIVHNDDPISKENMYRAIGDCEFITGSAPMTKSEVRTVSVGKLHLKNDYIIYDVGAGTGSVSIETALKLSNGTLYAIEKNEEACSLIMENIKKFKTYNVEVINSNAPEGLEKLPSPNACFIGGSSGNMEEIIVVLLEKNPSVRVVINAITLESLNEALECMKKYNFKDVDIVCISVAKAKELGRYHMMMAQNPIYIISGNGNRYDS
jgi:precorrin-6Y C5,15-methyltransferase (decarboxylating)